MVVSTTKSMNDTSPRQQVGRPTDLESGTQTRNHKTVRPKKKSKFRRKGRLAAFVQAAKPEAKRTPWTTPPQRATRFAKLLMPWSMPKDLAFASYSSLSLFPASSSS